jgi:hypothetical protein
LGNELVDQATKCKKTTKDGLFDKIISYFVDIVMFVLFVASYFN